MLKRTWDNVLHYAYEREPWEEIGRPERLLLGLWIMLFPPVIIVTITSLFVDVGNLLFATFWIAMFLGCSIIYAHLKGITIKQ